MVHAASRPLTPRQRDVMERIDRRVPIKVIADELGVSVTRVNQHIRALKDIYGADSLADLVECYRASEGYGQAPGEINAGSGPNLLLQDDTEHRDREGAAPVQIAQTRVMLRAGIAAIGLVAIAAVTLAMAY